MSRGHSSYQDYFQYDSVSLGGASLVSCESSARLLHRVSPAAAPGAATPALSPGGGSYQGRGAQQVSPYNYAGQDTVSVVCRTSLSMDPRKVILKSLSLVTEGRDDATIDLTADLATIKKQHFVLKEGVKFRIKIDFVVQREIVHGLKYVQKTFK